MTIGIKFSPSAARRWITCTASVRAIEKLERSPSGVFADDGSVAHLVFEDLKIPVGTVFPEYPKHPVNEEMIRYAQEANEYVSRVAVGGGEVQARFSELPFTITLGKTAVRGRLDLALLTQDNVLHVLDFKYGKGVREDAEGNPQLMLYALGSLLVLNELGTYPTSVELHILQPRLNHYSMHPMTLEEVAAFSDIASQAVQEALGDTPQYHPSEDTCRWCPLSGRCRAQAEAVHKRVAPLFNLSTLGQKRIEIAEWTKPSKLTDEELATAMRDVSFISEWCKTVSNRMREVVDEAWRTTGTAQAHGWKLKAGRKAARSWKDEHAARLAFRRAGLRAEEYIIETLRTPPAIEKLVGAVVYKAKIAPSVEEGKPGNPSLVPETDRAPALSGQPLAEAFGLTMNHESESDHAD